MSSPLRSIYDDPECFPRLVLTMSVVGEIIILLEITPKER
jgi:hypothetical protein